MSRISHKVVPKLSSISPSISSIYKIRKRPKYVKHTRGYSCVQTSTDGFLEPCTKMGSTVCQTANSIIIVHVKAVNYAVVTNLPNL